MEFWLMTLLVSLETYWLKILAKFGAALAHWLLQSQIPVVAFEK